MRRIANVATMATDECDAELHLFLTSLRQFEPTTSVFIGCTPSLLDSATSMTYRDFKTDSNIHWLPFISRDRYGHQLDRATMEGTPGIFYPTLHCDFMMEKATVMGYALERSDALAQLGNQATPAPNVLFMDCDLMVLSPLPQVPKQAVVGVSRHRIDPRDEALFGRFNGGWLYAADPSVLHQWKVHTHHSRFHDQASIEAVVEDYGGVESEAVFEFGPQCNYGYWRMFQAPKSPNELKAAALKEVEKFSLQQVDTLHSTEACLSIFYEQDPLQSVHTHLLMKNLEAKSRTMPLFNGLMKKWVGECATKGNVRYAAVARCLL